MAKEKVKFEVGLKRSRIFDSWRGEKKGLLENLSELGVEFGQ